MSIKTLLVSALVATAAGKAAAKPALPATETIYSIVEKHCFELTGPRATVDARLAVVQKTAAQHQLTVQEGECKKHGFATQVGKSTTFDGMKASQWQDTSSSSVLVETYESLNFLGDETVLDD